MKLAFALICTVAMLVAAGCGSDDVADTKNPTEPAKNSFVCPEGATGDKALDTDRLIGFNLAQAESEAKQFDCTVRPVEVDGEPQVTTMDLRQDRVNVVIESDEITAIKGVY